MNFNRHAKRFFYLVSASLISLILTCFVSTAYAAFQIDKVRSFLSVNNPIDTFKVTNSGKDNAVDLQGEIMAWTQNNGVDVLKPTTDIILSPPIMHIPPLKTQLIRIGLRTPTPLQVEKTYRFFLQEITKLAPLTQTGVRVKVRLSIPIFVMPTNPSYLLDWNIKNLSGKTLTINVKNVGNVHVQIISANLKTDDGTIVGSSPTKGLYLLAGQNRDIAFTMTNTNVKNVTLNADTDYVPMQANLTLP